MIEKYRELAEEPRLDLQEEEVLQWFESKVWVSFRKEIGTRLAQLYSSMLNCKLTTTELDIIRGTILALEEVMRLESSLRNNAVFVKDLNMRPDEDVIEDRVRDILERIDHGQGAGCDNGPKRRGRPRKRRD